MRVTAGTFKGLSLTVPPNIRPTEGRVRQAFFNILRDVVPGARVLDGFAGSGALGIEALSRGAASATFVEQDTECVLAIRANLEKLGDNFSRASRRVVHADFERGVRLLAQSKAVFDLVLLDPPYRTDEGKKALNDLYRYAMLAPGAILAVEHERRSELPETVGSIRRLKQHRYGETVLSFYQVFP